MNRPHLLLPVVLLLLSGAGCTLLRGGRPAPTPFGQWAYTMTHPSQGTITGLMQLDEQAAGGYTGHVTAVEIGLDDVLIVDSLERAGERFTMRGWVTGMELVLQGTVAADEIVGTNEVIGLAVFTFQAQRVPE